MGLSGAIQQAISPQPSHQSDPVDGSVAAGLAANVKPILQLNAFPVTLDPGEFKNPLSSSNPGGSLTALWAFRQLVDPVPTFTRDYNPSQDGTEVTYSVIVNGATVHPVSPFVDGVLAAARRALSLCYANVDGTPGTWLPVHATPDDWSDAASGRYQSVDFDPGSAGGAASPFAELAGDENPLSLRIEGGSAGPQVRAVESASRVKRVSMKYLRVGLSRPWLNGMLFSTAGWILSGQHKGFCSSGTLSGPPGVLQLLPTSIIFARDVTVDAEWSAGDQAVLDAGSQQGHQASLGPLIFQPRSGTEPVQILGWVSALVPLCPTKGT